MANYTPVYAEADISEATISLAVKMLITVATFIVIIVVVMLARWIKGR